MHVVAHALVALGSASYFTSTGLNPSIGFNRRHACIVASADKPVVVLGLSGVLFNTEPESVRTAWRTANELWPDKMAAAAALDPREAGARRAWVGGEWDELQGEGPDGMPNWLRYKVRELRPAVLETGFETVLMMRLCADEALNAQKSRTIGRSERPLTPGEITTNWPELRDVLFMRYGLQREEAIKAYSGVREAWLDSEPDTWLAASTVYDGAVDALRHAVDADLAEVYVSTSTSKVFAKALLSSAGIHLDEARIFGQPEYSGPKAATLQELRAKHPEASSISFVEDTAESLRAIANDVSLFGLRLYFAEWGYSTPEQQRLASSMPRVTTLRGSEDLAGVFASREEEDDDDDGGGSSSSRGGDVRMVAAAVMTSATPSSPLDRCASNLAEAADRMVSAAAILGENQRQEEEPGALSAVGCSLANAGRDLGVAGSALSVDGDWPSAAVAIGDAAQQLEAAATSMDGWGADEGMYEAAEELEDASSCTGCISLAAAAGPNLRAAGEALSGAAEAVATRAAGLEGAPTLAIQTAGVALSEAAVALREAANGLDEAGGRLETGTAGPL